MTEEWGVYVVAIVSGGYAAGNNAEPVLVAITFLIIALALIVMAINNVAENIRELNEEQQK